MLYVRRLIWNARNVAHIARHKVAPEEVEQVCHGDHEDLKSYKGRIILIGPTKAGKMLAVVLEREEDHIYYPVTARPASRNERGYYQGVKGGSEL